MNWLDTILGTPLGHLMYFCYQLLKNYGWAIVLFTLFTKIILLPVSVWVQKNSIKIVRIQPEINRIKASFFGDKDTIAEKQAALYKREKYNPFASIIPLAIQIVLLMGLVTVIYNPLTHLFHLDLSLISSMVSLTGELTGADITSSSIQMAVVDAVKNPEYYSTFLGLQAQFPAKDLAVLLPQIQQTNMSLFSVSLGIIPITSGGLSLLMPLAAALAAWLLCVAQNKLNPLQAEQGKFNQIGMTIFSVGLSLFLGAFVPLGVGFYWIFSNLFSILQQVLLNIMIDPKKQIDYAALESSKKDLAALDAIGSENGKRKRDPNAKRENVDYKRFFTIANKHLVFYSESSGFYKYFQNIIEYLTEHSNITIHYVTSDPNDAIFQSGNPKIKPYYIGHKKLITFMMKMDADMVVMTMPDLQQYHIKRSYVRDDIEYVYTDHGISSNNLTLRKGAMAYFDTIFCVGPHQMEEYQKEEEVYNLRPRNLLPVGYGLLDNMRAAYKKSDQRRNAIKTVLIAPSWQKDNIFDICLDELLTGLLAEDVRIILRPHPQYVRLYREKMNLIAERYKQRLNENFVIELDFSSNETVYSADILITDWSNIGYEFSFTTYKPTLFINTPMKIMNPEYEKLGITPFDVRIRSKLGAELELTELGCVGETVQELIEKTPTYYNQIERIREESFYHPGESGKVGGQYIINSLKEIQAKKKSNA